MACMHVCQCAGSHKIFDAFWWYLACWQILFLRHPVPGNGFCSKGQNFRLKIRPWVTLQ